MIPKSLHFPTLTSNFSARGFGCALLASLLSVQPALSQEVYDPERFEKTELIGQLIQPMAIAIAPNDDVYLIELGGIIKRLGHKDGSVEIVGTLSVTTEQENGLIGIALDPNFSNNQWMYLQYSPPGFSGQHISRFTLIDGKLDLGSEKLLLKYEEQRKECCHHAGEMAFGPDGCLYIGTGDNTNPFGDSNGYAPMDNREGMSAFTALRTSSNTDSYNGKVLRIRPKSDGTYEIPEGNLFPKDGSRGLPEIFVMGCRNPWRISVDSKSGDLYWGDVGPDAGGDGPRGPRGYDEINQAKKAGYFGWPLFIANNKPYFEYDYKTQTVGKSFDPTKPLNNSPFNTGAKELPPAQSAWIYYPAGDSKEFPILGSGGRTACAGPAYYFNDYTNSETKVPKHFDNCLFIFEWSRNWIMAVHRHEDGSVKTIEPFLPTQKFTRPIDIEFNSQGAMYVVEYGETWGVNPDAKLVRLDYIRGNRKPTVQVHSSAIAGKDPLSVSLTSTGTSDRDDDQLSYRWSMRNISSLEQSRDLTETVLGTDPSLNWVAESPGVYEIKLLVDDGNGGTASKEITITAGNSLPVVDFERPRQGDFYTPGQAFAYRLKITDLEDGTTHVEDEGNEDLDDLDVNAPIRTTVQAEMVASDATADEDNIHPGLKLIRASDCLNCHSVQAKLVGPSFLEIADKYRLTPDELDKTAERVITGSTGVWGKVAMLPHAQYSLDQAREMVQWIYRVEPNPSSEYRTGVSNEVALLTKVPDFTGKLRLTASYVDLGNGAIPPLTATKIIDLRSRLVQAEQADHIHDMAKLSSHNASDGKFCGSINHGSYLRINNVALDQFHGVTARVTSAGAGGNIEVRVGAVDGPVVGTMVVKVNGDWDGWYEVSTACELSKLPEPHLTSDIYIVCTNEANRGALMNIDWVRFDP